MKKTFKTLTTLLALFSLTACNNYGKQISKEEAEGVYDEIAKATETLGSKDCVIKLPKVLTYAMKGNFVQKETGKDDVNSHGIFELSRDVDKVYLHQKDYEEFSDREDKMEEDWLYLNNDKTKFISAHINGDIKKYSEVSVESPAMLQLIKEEIEGMFISAKTMYSYTFGDTVYSNFSRMIETYFGKFDDPNESKLYSKGKGNLTFVEKIDASVKTKKVDGTTESFAKVKSNYVFTIDNYIIKSMTQSLNGESIEGTGENQHKFTISTTTTCELTSKCELTYPDLSTFTKVDR